MIQTMVSETDQDFTPVVIDRDERGRVKKGQALNPRGGQDRRLYAMKKKLDDLTPRALNALAKLVEDEGNPSVRLNAAIQILDRTLGKPKQSVSLDVTSTSAMHLAALEELSARARRTIDITPTPIEETVREGKD